MNYLAVRDQFHEDAASGARVVAIPGGVSRSAQPGAGALGRAPIPATHCRYGHPKAAAEILPAGLTPAGEQLAQVAQKHLPQRSYRILDWRNLCLNSYTALLLGRYCLFVS